MDDLFSHYERELVALRRLSREFADRYPKVAGNLHMVGETCDDPHVERLIQSVALLGARVSKRLDDDYPQFTQALLNTLFPHLLRPFPSCAIVQVTSKGASSAGTTIARGTYLKSPPVQGIACTFVTTYDLSVAPIEIVGAQFHALIQAPSAIHLPVGANACLSMQMRVNGAWTSTERRRDTVRVYMDGEPSFCAALRDALFMRAKRAYVQCGDAAWTACASIPVLAVGFEDDDALMPHDVRSPSAYRILTEYFAFPEKFNFFDIDLGAIRRLLPDLPGTFRIHIALAGHRADSPAARTLSGLSEKNLLPGCTPVVNLFRQAGVPIAVDQRTAEYTVLAHHAQPAAFEVYRADRVGMLRQRGGTTSESEFRPLYSSRFASNAQQGDGFYMLTHDETLASVSPGHETQIALYDLDYDPAVIEKHTLSLELTCTNRDLPRALAYGQPHGDLALPGVARGQTIQLLRRPTRSLRFKGGAGAHWRLISHLTLNHHGLSAQGLGGLREMLSLYDLPQSPISQRQIAGVTGLAYTDTVAWIRNKRGTCLVHGVEVRMTLDEDAFVGASVHLFIQVIERFLSLYTQVNSFIELVVLAKQSGEEIFRCQPRSGTTTLA